MKTAILSSLLTVLLPLLATALTAAISAAVLAWRKHLVANAKTVPLADAVDIAGQALDAAVKSVGGGKWPPSAAAWKQAEDATFSVLKAHKGDLEDDALAELKALCSTAVALKAGQPVTTPGGGTVAMPTPKGLAHLGLLAVLCLAIAAGLLVALGAQAAPSCAAGQVTNPYTSTCEAQFKEGQFSHGPMLSGFLFRLQDPATHQPADYSFGAGVGYSVDWDFVPEDFGPTIGFDKPLISLGFGALGVGTEDANQLLLSLGAGPEFCFVDHLACLLFVPDLAQVFGSQVTGLLVGKLGPANIATALTIGFQFGGSGQLSTR